MFNERVLGVLYVGSRELAHFDELDVELLELMAERLAVALERVQAFEAERDPRVRDRARCRPPREAAVNYVSARDSHIDRRDSSRAD